MCIIALGENSKIHDQTLTKLFFLPQILTQNKKEQGAARKKVELQPLRKCFETFSSFSVVSLLHNWNGTTLLSPQLWPRIYQLPSKISYDFWDLSKSGKLRKVLPVALEN